MPDEINREGLLRTMKLSARVGDKRLLRVIRRYLARWFRQQGRPFRMPRDLDLEGLMSALRRRLEDEEAFLGVLGDRLDADMEKLRAKFDERERQAYLRIWALQLTLQVAYRPPRDPASFGSGQGAQLPGVHIRRKRRRAAADPADEETP